MQCPKCSQQMEKVFTKFGIVDRCTGCSGLWLDALEDQDLAGCADVVDTGAAALGKKFNAIDKIDCPACPATPMLRMVDADQPHVWFESCPTCRGRFYDAGEFRDVSEHTLGDFFKRLVAKPRS